MAQLDRGSLRTLSFGLVVALLVSGAFVTGQESGRGKTSPAPELVRPPKEEEQPLILRQVSANADGWSLAETRNFRIWHYHSRKVVEQAARSAEDARAAALTRWFKEAGETWEPRCDLYLYTSPADFSRYSGAPAAVPGVATTRCDNGRVVSRRVDLCISAEHCFEAVLPHEVTHSVLAGSFSDNPLSIWANEGIAVLAEPRSRIDLHLRKLPQYREQDQLYGVRQLFYLGAYPEPRSLGPFYAQSVSLVEFLVKEKDAQTVTQFLHDGLRDGYEKALQKHYSWTFKELETRWRQHAFRAGG